MKLNKLCAQYGFKENEFENYLIHNNIKYNSGLTNGSIEDNRVPSVVEEYKKYLEGKEERELEKAKAEKERLEAQIREEPIKQKALAEMLITSGFSFEGYRITKYSGYISGDDAIEISRGVSGLLVSATDVGAALTGALVKIRRQALKELKEAAYDLGCNAVIGVDFDYITLEPETATSTGGKVYLPYVFCVTANGNAVVIEKDDTR